MGFFDALLNPTPEQSAGLLGFAANFNNAIGGGNRPVNLGAAFAAGAQGMQQSRDQYQDRQRELQMLEMQRKLYDLKLQDAEGEFADKQQQRERDARILKRLQGLQGLPMLGDDVGSQAGGEPGAGSAVPPIMPQMKAMSDSALPAGDQAVAFVPASVFATNDGAQFPSTAALMRGLDGLPKLQDSGAAQARPQLPLPPPAMRQGSVPPRQTATQIAVQQMLAHADIYATEGDAERAAKIYADVAKLQPQVDKIDIAMREGQPVRVITFKDGREEVSQFGAKPDMVGVDLGGTYEFVDKNRVQPGRSFQKTQTPNSRAEDARFAARGGGSADASLDADTLDMMADQALRGDTSVFKNLGRGAQGSANLVELRSRITQKAKALGISGADLAAITADYGGLATGMRVSANISARVENAISEARELAPLAIAAGRDVARVGLLPFGKAQVMFDTQTNDPALKKFAAANVGFVQAYAGAMARGQKPTVHDKEHAEKLISEATSQKAYEAVMDQLMLEMDAASRAPQKVREHLRNEIGGRSGAGHDTPRVPNPMAPAAASQFTVKAPNGRTYSFPDAKSLANYKLSAGIK